MTRSELLNRMTVLLGGRAAEVAAFHEATTGAADDLQRATEMARAMTTRYGMEPSVGQASFVAERPRYLDVADLGQRRSEASEETSAKIDRAVRELVDEAFARATKILIGCATIHEDSARRLLDAETFGEEELEPIRVAVRARLDDLAGERPTSVEPPLGASIEAEGDAARDRAPPGLAFSA
jgi:cell division protease FtsH